MPRVLVSPARQEELAKRVDEAVARQDYHALRDLLFDPTIFLAIAEEEAFVIERLLKLPHQDNRDLGIIRSPKTTYHYRGVDHGRESWEGERQEISGEESRE